MYKKRRKRIGTQISLLTAWDAAEKRWREAKDRAQKAITKCLDPNDWLFVYIGDKDACSLCFKNTEECKCHGGAVIRRDHDILNLGDIRQNIGNALVDLARLGGFPEGTIIVTKVKKPIYGSMIGYKKVTKNEIVHIPATEADQFVEWEKIARLLEGRFNYKERTSMFSRRDFDSKIPIKNTKEVL